MNFVLLPAIIGSDTCENRLSFFVLCMLAFEKVIKIKPTLILIYDRVEYLMVPGSIQIMIATHITDNNITLHPMKLFLNGAQLILRGFKERLKSVFKGIPFVSKATSVQNRKSDRKECNFNYFLNFK